MAKREVERLLAEHEEQRRRLRLPPLSPEQREAVIEGFRQRVVVPNDDGSMPWSDIQMLQYRLARRRRPGASTSRSCPAKAPVWSQLVGR